MTKREWSNVPGNYCRELYKHDGAWWHTSDDSSVDGGVATIIEGSMPRGCNYVEMVIEFKSSGYYLPMSMYDGPDMVGWPEEGDDEREITGITLLAEDGTKVRLNASHYVQAVYDMGIQEADLDVSYIR